MKAPRSIVHVLSAYWFALASLFSAPSGFSEPNAEQAARVIASDLRTWSERAAEYVTNDEKFGIMITATQLPSVGRVLMSGDGEHWSCSGVLVSSRHVLTAAHCLCGTTKQAQYAPTEKQCAPLLDELSVKVLFPTVGLFIAKKPYKVHPEYRSPGEDIVVGKTKIADVAVLTLETDVSLEPAVLTNTPGQAGERLLLAGYGKFGFSNGRSEGGWKRDTPYEEGVKQISRQKPAWYDPGACGGIPAVDTFCTHFSDLGVSKGSEQDAGACGGDSGSPLLKVVEGKVTVVGVLSYFSPKGLLSCDGAGSRFNHFVDAYLYHSWIEGQVGGSFPTAARRVKCLEEILEGPIMFPLKAGSGVLSVTGFNQRGFDRPSVAVKGPKSLECVRDDEFGVTVCQVHELSTLEIGVPMGLCQLTMCEVIDELSQ